MAGIAFPYKFVQLPHQVQIGGGLPENCMIRLTGRTFENPSSFSMHLSCGADDGDDAPFVLISSILSGQITLKTQNSACWVNPQVSIRTPYFKVAAEFDLTIECTIDAFMVRFGEEEHRYNHKLPFYTARYLTIKGDVNIQHVQVNGVAAGEEDLRIPVTRRLFEKPNGTEVIVRGVPVCAKSQSRRMAIDFSTDSGNLAFHFNPRFYNSTLVRNNLIENVWGTEETDLQVPFPFVYGVAFELTFHIDEGCFKVRLNGHPLCKFERGTPGNLQHMAIYGSVAITRAEVRRI